MVLENDIKHDRVCKSVTEIKDHAKNFPNAPYWKGTGTYTTLKT